MKKFFKFMVLMAVVIGAMASLCASAETVEVTTANFPVIINGNFVNNRMREYPFIVYKDITYFPMTYEDCAFLGVENNWSAESGNTLAKTTSSGVYCDYLSTELSLVDHSKYATIVSTPITVLGESINNASQEFPILNYNNVLYFPLTWDWSQKFGWRTTFTQAYPWGILEVTTEDFADTGFFFLYSIDSNKEPKKLEIAKTDFLYLTSSCYNAEYSYSRNYCGKTEVIPAGYKLLYRLVASDSVTIAHIIANDTLCQKFKQSGWYEIGEEERAIAEFTKNHSTQTTRSAIYDLPSIRVEQSSLITKLSEKLNDYETLISTDGRVCAAKKEDIASYKSVGWLSENDYLNYYVNRCVASGDTATALTFLQVVLGEEGVSRSIVLDCVYPWNYDYESALSLCYDLENKILAKMKKSVEVRGVYRRDGSGSVIVFNCAIPSEKTINSVEITFDIVDASGKVLETRTVTENIYAANYNTEKLFMTECVEYGFETIGENSIRNVRIKKINTVNTDFRPGGQGW